MKTKFEALDPEVIEYEEGIHGPSVSDTTADQHELEKMSTSSSAESADTIGSVEEEDVGVEKK